MTKATKILNLQKRDKVPISISEVLKIFKLTTEYELMDLMSQPTEDGKLARKGWLTVKAWLQNHANMVNLYQLKHLDELEAEYLKPKDELSNVVLQFGVLPEGEWIPQKGFKVVNPGYIVKDGEVYYDHQLYLAAQQDIA